MTTATLPPGWTLRGAAVLAAIDPRWDPETRRSIHHEPKIGPQDDASDPAVRFGLPLYLYSIGLLLTTLAMVLVAGVSGLKELSDGQSYAVVSAAVLWAVCFSGLLDYARRGARR